MIVTTADINGDGRADIITGTDQGGGARVRIFNGLDNTVIADFVAIEDPNFRGGVRVAMGDVNGDGVPDLVASAGYGGGPRVAVFDGRALLGGVPVHLVPDFFAFESTLRNGVYIATGDLDGDHRADIIVGAGPGELPGFMGLNGSQLLGENPADVVAKPMFDFFAGLGDDRGGVRVGGIPRTDGRVDIMAVDGSGGDALVYDVDSHKVSRTVNREVAYGAGLIDDRMPATAAATTRPAPGRRPEPERAPRELEPEPLEPGPAPRGPEPRGPARQRVPQPRRQPALFNSCSINWG